MRKFDFTKLGGMPWYQNQFDFMQKAYQEPLLAMAKMAGNGPFIFHGVEELIVGSGTVTDGVIFYNGDFIPFVGGAVGNTIVVNTYTTTLVFADGLTKEVMTRKEAHFGTGVVQFNYQDLKPYQEGFGAVARKGWITLKDDSAGYVVYTHNVLTNRVAVRGWVTHQEGVSSSTETWAVVLGAQLPANLVPASLAGGYSLQFPTSIAKDATIGGVKVIKDMSGTVYEQGVIAVSTNGTMGLLGRKLAAGTTMPKHIFNFSYDL